MDSEGQRESNFCQGTTVLQYRDTNIGSEWDLTYSRTCSLSRNWKRYLGTLDYLAQTAQVISLIGYKSAQTPTRQNRVSLESQALSLFLLRFTCTLT